MAEHLLQAAPTPEAALAPPASALNSLLDVVRSMFPDNVATAAVNMNILGVITVSLFFGACLSMLGEAADNFIALIDVSLQMHCAASAGLALIAEQMLVVGYSQHVPLMRHS